MGPTRSRPLPVVTATLVVACSQLSPAIAHADMHNITYIARIDGVAPGSQATFVINGGQTDSAPLSAMPGQVFEADEVLADPQRAGLQVALHWPYSANVHCEIDVDGNVATQVDRVVSPKQGSDPSTGVLGCGAPLPG
ncbi:hypothetical protein [Mycobacterium parmense]|uniref:Uncharacterized protein n=1 Tax=Mycobacterium parmense TaxID=185642 RepID=A0A7I7YT93_9MYCO|nr:hypothetical protein [Mycobacterium parmense]MCV7348899.1 hypothetical protein [Mycobacterium parmense]ORW53201.1 hypothetical protein AWC20_20500 [Mycobacterium parmense]BBZ44412.1 hypothetical protein MPRM_16930 [Mycobacterium parmense]